MVTLTFLTFCLGVLADYVINQRKRKSGAVANETARTAAVVPVRAGSSPAYVEGFLVLEGRSYHSGHTWVQREQLNTARVGVDEFGAKLAGHIDTIELPEPGQWFRQGQTVCKLHRNGQTATLLCPIEGEVVAVNPEVVNNPSLLRSDPYGKGWLMTLHYDEISTWRNLLPVSLVKDWLEEDVSRLYAKQPAVVGAVASDRGTLGDDLLASKPGADWSRITAEFFLP
jgi:glycine cleavage system H protein